MNGVGTWSLVASCGLHALVLFGVGSSLIQPAEFGVQTGRNSLEVNLVAAPTAAAPTPPRAPDAVAPPPQPVQPDDFVIPETVAPPEPRAPVAKPERAVTARTDSTAVTQPSSPGSTGKDSATLQSAGGAVSRSKPGYLRNPEPPYPEKARRLGQEGVVVLAVVVNERGEAESVEVKEGSGHPLLDEAALKAVRRWVFKPAMAASVPVTSEIEIPVRFNLHDQR